MEKIYTGKTKDVYQLENGKKFSVKIVNEIILNRLDKIISAIKKCIDTFEMEMEDYIPIRITGGGLNFIQGVSDYFRKAFEREVRLTSPKALLYRRPDLSSSISLLNMAINLYK